MDPPATRPQLFPRVLATLRVSLNAWRRYAFAAPGLGLLAVAGTFLLHGPLLSPSPTGPHAQGGTLAHLDAQCERGDAWSCVESGRAYFSRGDVERALARIGRAYASPDADAGLWGPARPIHVSNTADIGALEGRTQDKHLHISSAPEKFVLNWKQAGWVIEAIDVPREPMEDAELPGAPDGGVRFAALAAQIGLAWAARGSHMDPSDKEFDSAVIHTDSLDGTSTGMTYDAILGVIEAIRHVQRRVDAHGQDVTVPAFNVTLSIPARTDAHEEAGPTLWPDSVASGPRPAFASAPRAKVQGGAIQVNGHLPQEVIERIVKQNFGRFRLCYQNGLRKKPDLAGRVVVKFVIAGSGEVASSADRGSDLPDREVVACVVRGFSNLSFPEPDAGTVTVVYPILLAPGDSR